jgi:SAM-dependent methyltransferase
MSTLTTDPCLWLTHDNPAASYADRAAALTTDHFLGQGWGGAPVANNRVITVIWAAEGDLVQIPKKISEALSAADMDVRVEPWIKDEDPGSIHDVACVVAQDRSDPAPAEVMRLIDNALRTNVPVITLVGENSMERGQIAQRHGVQIKRYPDVRRDDTTWDTGLQTALATQVMPYVEQACRDHSDRQVVKSIVENATHMADALARAHLDPPVAGAIAESIGLALGQVQVFEADDRGRLTFEFPFELYGRLLSSLSKAFPGEVYAVADPFSENLQWSDAVLSAQLTTVRRRYFVIDESQADAHGIENRARAIRQAAAAARPAAAEPRAAATIEPAEPILICALSDAVKAQLEVAQEDGLFDGYNRFFVSQNIVGGYASVQDKVLRLVVFADADDQACAKQASMRRLLEGIGQPVPLTLTDDTEMAAWLFRDILHKTNVRGILQPAEHGPYASCYDSTMVRVTPEYFGHLNKLSEAATDSVLDRYRSGHKEIGILELGYGTGALTVRLARSLEQIAHIFNAHTKEPISLTYQGWDVNGFMKDIAEVRLRAARTHFPIDMLVRDFGDDSSRRGAFDIVVGSFVTQNWVSQDDDDRSIRFFEWVETLLEPGGRALFLNAFYPDRERRGLLRGHYQTYLVDNLGPEMAAEYIQRFPAQVEAPTHNKVQAYAREAGLATEIISQSEYYPFAILKATKH